jgi:protein gp37
LKASKIEWTESTWNPVTGCTKLSAGCKNCYAERMAKRLQAMGQDNYKNGFQVTCHDKVLEYPLKWKKSQTIFVNSMSDLFHEDLSVDFIKKIFEVMNKASWH